jgi:hypothetical protein
MYYSNNIYCTSLSSARQTRIFVLQIQGLVRDNQGPSVTASRAKISEAVNHYLDLKIIFTQFVFVPKSVKKEKKAYIF